MRGMRGEPIVTAKIIILSEYRNKRQRIVIPMLDPFYPWRVWLAMLGIDSGY